MKTNYYTDIEAIEENAKFCLSLFEAQENISQIAVFPDIHYCSEKSIPVGVAFRAADVFYPLVTGKDMGCGVGYLRIDKKRLLREFDKNKHYKAFERESFTMTDEGIGGGNHFLSLEESDKFFYIIIHTGSRNLGIHMFQKNLSLLSEYNPGQEWLPIELATEEYINDYNRVVTYAASRRTQFILGSLEFLRTNKYIEGDIPLQIEDSCHNLLEFTTQGVIHRKGSTKLDNNPVAIPLSMTRGTLFVKKNEWNIEENERSLHSCSHGAGRKYSRTDTLKFWHSLKKSDKEAYKKKFPELLNRNGEFESSILQEFDFGYKESDTILETQPHLIKADETKPIVTVKFTGV